MKKQNKYPTGDQFSTIMSGSGIKINGMKVLFDEKVTLMPIKTVSTKSK